jgi:cytochrome c oxidase subunit 4
MTAPAHDPAATQDDAHGHQGRHHHVASSALFGRVLVALLILTVVTVAVSRFDFGGANLLIAMGIAAVKASLVISFFMHLKWDTPINQIAFLGSFLFLSLLLLFTLADLSTRGRANPTHRIKAPVNKQWVHPARPQGAI